MMRSAAALILGLTLFCAAVAPAPADDRVVKLLLDGRPVDRAGGVAVAHNGIVYADLVDLVKSFNGLLTFQGSAVEVSIGSTVARFTAGSRTAKIDQGAITMRGPAIMRNGDMYVPLETFVVRVAKAKLRVAPGLSQAEILVNANPQS